MKCPHYESRRKTTACLINRVKSELDNGALKKKTLVWLELNGCAGNIISILDGVHPDFQYLISEMADFVYSNSLMAAEGGDAIHQLFSVIGGDYVLAVEGAVSLLDNGAYTIIGKYNGRTITGLEAVKMLGENAEYVISVGACATHGGVSAAVPNPTGCVGVQKVLENKRVIKLPGCPCNPDWFMGTFAHILLYGEPPLDNRDRPLMFYSTTIHDQCPRLIYFNQGIFATKLGEETCMFKLGCRGPVTRTDCPVRQWNNHVNWPIGDDSNCIGCAQFGFPDAMEPFISYDTTRGD
ncbi:hydrogenase small subunit [Clostridium aminobutyricum]|uniref:Hydrogenase small subunit n=1 Tax=Clostridium aminobutyricum TaxID=33953 RepID=A0A939DAY6_CLOAM|nr:hydrogenase small subunit [Clostridium aminobutyricum]MBN7773963.1 hydrogenase small subunit [Clostridium aminobutyricum]